VEAVDVGEAGGGGALLRELHGERVAIHQRELALGQQRRQG